MNKIFIDANIYLGFYNSNKSEFKKLLISLVELRDRILITDQIIDEITRNKLNVFKVSIDNYLKQGHIISTSLPEHLGNDIAERIADWNARRKGIEEHVKAINKELDDIVKDTLEEIATSKDKVSTELGKIFANPLKVTQAQYTNAKTRKELGNPPGKSDDPIGDQLNWIQLLGNLKEVDNLWIVTNDYDYYIEHDKKCYLNPFLYNELITLNPKIEVYVFNKLSDALRDFNTKEKITSLPQKGELESIAKEEPTGIITGITVASPMMYGGGHAVPSLCPACASKNTFHDGAYLRSRFGGLTYQYICTHCGYQFDTGDFFE